MSLKSVFEKPLIIVLVLSLIIPAVRFVFAAAPNPGHTWSEIGDIAVTVAQGGTGLASIAAGSILYASSANTLSAVAPTASNQVLRSTAANALQFAALVAADIPNLDMSKITTGTLGVSQGGTGLTSLTANNVILGNGTSTPSFVAPGANGNVLTSNGTTWTSAAPTGGGSNELLDGTNHTDTLAGSVVRGDVIIGNSTPKWSRLPMGTQGQVLSVNRDGTDLEWNYPTRMYSTKREMVIFKNGGAATISAIGLVAPTLTATASSADDATGAFLNNATSTTSGNASGIVSTTFTVLRRDWEPEYLTRIKTDATAVTLLRYWVGFFSASPDAIARGTGTIHMAAFSYDTGIDGTAFWRTVTSGGVANTFTTTTTTTAIAANTEYELYINCATATNDCKFYINDVLVATHTTNLPTATQTMGYANRVVTLTTAAKNLKTQSIYIRHNH